MRGTQGYDWTADRDRLSVLDQNIIKMREWLDGSRSTAQGITESFSGISTILASVAAQSAASIDKQKADLDTKYRATVDYIANNPIVVDANIDPLRDKLQTVLSEYEQLQSKISRGFQGIRSQMGEMPSDWDYTVDVGMTKSPRKPFSQGYSELVQMLMDLPKQSDFTVDVGGFQNVGSADIQMAQARASGMITSSAYSIPEGANPEIANLLVDAINKMRDYFSMPVGGNVQPSGFAMGSYYQNLIPTLTAAAQISTGQAQTVNIAGINISIPAQDKDKGIDLKAIMAEIERQLASRLAGNRSGGLVTQL
jgi:hypothetical protein